MIFNTEKVQFRFLPIFGEIKSADKKWYLSVVKKKSKIKGDFFLKCENKMCNTKNSAVLLVAICVVLVVLQVAEARPSKTLM